LYLGEGSVPFMLPGFTFTLENHYRKAVNQNYLITDIDHEGNQTGYLLSGISVGRSGDEENKIYYRNHFTAIPGSVQFRPEVKTEKPKISGTISGMIDAAGSGQYAELDPQGRYKIIFPFDLSGRTGGKASNWVRMVSPYAGSDHGMHFPLHKGTEVLITFIDGDPDRPIIAGAVPNPETPSPVSGANQSMSVIQTAGQNKITVGDQEGGEHILLQSPNQNSFIRIGAPPG
jgi:type VI secretion system secreted protein VgrG